MSMYDNGQNEYIMLCRVMYVFVAEKQIKTCQEFQLQKVGPKGQSYT